jgi:hypothetical protein
MAKKNPSRKVTPHRATGLSIKSLHGPTIFSAEITTDRNEYPSGKKQLYKVNRRENRLFTRPSRTTSIFFQILIN